MKVIYEPGDIVYNSNNFGFVLVGSNPLLSVFISLLFKNSAYSNSFRLHFVKQKPTLSSGMAAPSESMGLRVDKIFSYRR